MKRLQCVAQTQAVVDIAERFRVQLPSGLVSPEVAESKVLYSRECLQIDHSVYGLSCLGIDFFKMKKAMRLIFIIELFVCYSLRT